MTPGQDAGERILPPVLVRVKPGAARTVLLCAVPEPEPEASKVARISPVTAAIAASQPARPSQARRRACRCFPAVNRLLSWLEDPKWPGRRRA